MVWRTFTATYKLSFIAMPSGRQTTIDFVEIMYDGVVGLFLNAQKDTCRLVLMEDGASIHRTKAPTI